MLRAAHYNSDKADALSSRSPQRHRPGGILDLALTAADKYALSLLPGALQGQGLAEPGGPGAPQPGQYQYKTHTVHPSNGIPPPVKQRSPHHVNAAHLSNTLPGPSADRSPQPPLDSRVVNSWDASLKEILAALEPDNKSMKPVKLRDHKYPAQNHGMAVPGSPGRHDGLSTTPGYRGKASPMYGSPGKGGSRHSRRPEMQSLDVQYDLLPGVKLAWAGPGAYSTTGLSNSPKKYTSTLVGRASPHYAASGGAAAQVGPDGVHLPDISSPPAHQHQHIPAHYSGSPYAASGFRGTAYVPPSYQSWAYPPGSSVLASHTSAARKALPYVSSTPPSLAKPLSVQYHPVLRSPAGGAGGGRAGPGGPRAPAGEGEQQQQGDGTPRSPRQAPPHRVPYTAPDVAAELARLRHTQELDGVISGIRTDMQTLGGRPDAQKPKFLQMYEDPNRPLASLNPKQLLGDMAGPAQKGRRDAGRGPGRGLGPGIKLGAAAGPGTMAARSPMYERRLKPITSVTGTNAAAEGRTSVSGAGPAARMSGAGQAPAAAGQAGAEDEAEDSLRNLHLQPPEVPGEAEAEAAAAAAPDAAGGAGAGAAEAEAAAGGPLSDAGHGAEEDLLLPEPSGRATPMTSAAGDDGEELADEDVEAAAAGEATGEPEEHVAAPEATEPDEPGAEAPPAEAQPAAEEQEALGEAGAGEAPVQPEVAVELSPAEGGTLEEPAAEGAAAQEAQPEQQAGEEELQPKPEEAQAQQAEQEAGEPAEVAVAAEEAEEGQQAAAAEAVPAEAQAEEPAAAQEEAAAPTAGDEAAAAAAGVEQEAAAEAEAAAEPAAEPAAADEEAAGEGAAAELAPAPAEDGAPSAAEDAAEEPAERPVSAGEAAAAAGTVEEVAVPAAEVAAPADEGRPPSATAGAAEEAGAAPVEQEQAEEAAAVDAAPEPEAATAASAQEEEQPAPPAEPVAAAEEGAEPQAAGPAAELAPEAVEAPAAAEEPAAEAKAEAEAPAAEEEAAAVAPVAEAEAEAAEQPAAPADAPAAAAAAAAAPPLPPHFPELEIAEPHVIRIQSHIRGHLARKQVQALRANAEAGASALAAAATVVSAQKAEHHADMALLSAYELPQGVTDEQVEAAAVRVQAHMRGHLARKRVAGLKQRPAAAGTSGSAARAAVSVGREGATQEEMDAAALKVQAHMRGHLARKRVAGIRRDKREAAVRAVLPPGTSLEDAEVAVVRLQAGMRGYLARKQAALRRRQLEQAAAPPQEITVDLLEEALAAEGEAEGEAGAGPEGEGGVDVMGSLRRDDPVVLAAAAAAAAAKGAVLVLGDVAPGSEGADVDPAADQAAEANMARLAANSARLSAMFQGAGADTRYSDDEAGAMDLMDGLDGLMEGGDDAAAAAAVAAAAAPLEGELVTVSAFGVSEPQALTASQSGAERLGSAAAAVAAAGSSARASAAGAAAAGPKAGGKRASPMDILEPGGVRLLAGKYEVQHVVGEGAYGMVMKCKVRGTEPLQWVAIKEFKIDDSDPDAEDVKRTSLREVAVLENLQHPHVVRFVDKFMVGDRLFIVMEFLPCNLLELLEAQPGGMDRDAVRLIMFQLCSAIASIHSKLMVYRDIKPENLLVDERGTVKLCDFGFARRLPSKPTSHLTDYVATRWYRAPELLLGPPFRDATGKHVQFMYGPPVDMWAIGCLMGELLDGEPLFAGDSDLDQLYRVQQILGPMAPAHQYLFYANPHNTGIVFNIKQPLGLAQRYAGKMNDVELDFLGRLLDLDPDTRMTGEQCLQHPYLADLAAAVQGAAGPGGGAAGAGQQAAAGVSAEDAAAAEEAIEVLAGGRASSSGMAGIGGELTAVGSLRRAAESLRRASSTAGTPPAAAHGGAAATPGSLRAGSLVRTSGEGERAEVVVVEGVPEGEEEEVLAGNTVASLRAAFDEAAEEAGEGGAGAEAGEGQQDD